MGVHVCECLGRWARRDNFMFSAVMICITDFLYIKIQSSNACLLLSV